MEDKPKLYKVVYYTKKEENGYLVTPRKNERLYAIKKRAMHTAKLWRDTYEVEINGEFAQRSQVHKMYRVSVQEFTADFLGEYQLTNNSLAGWFCEIDSVSIRQKETWGEFSENE